MNVTSQQGGAGDPAPNAAAFIVGIADRGPVAPTRVNDLLDFQAKFGGRSGAAALLSDSVELVFGEGGYGVYVSRVTGPTPTLGTLSLVDRTPVTPVPTVRLDAAWYGAASAQVSVSVAAAASGLANAVDVFVYDATSVSSSSPVELYRDILTVGGADGLVTQINAGSAYLHAADLGSSSTGVTALPAVMAATPLTAGTDDRTNAADGNWTTAINRFGNDLGPGLMLAPGQTSSGVQLALASASANTGRMALCDTVSTPSATAVVTQAQALSASSGFNANGDSAMLCTPWVTLPPAPGGSAPRPVPASAFYAGIIARNDGQAGHSNQAAIGSFGIAHYANGIYGTKFTEQDRTTISGRQGTTGACVITSRPTSPVESFGFRTVSTAPNSYFAANIRQTLLIKAQVQLLGDRFVGRQIDGRGLVFSDVATEITELLNGYYVLNALYGALPSDAFGVDVGPTVNTPSTIAQGLIKSRTWFVPSPTGERVIFDLVRQGVSS